MRPYVPLTKTCSPELNPVEHLRDELREKWFRNKYFASLDAAEDQLADALKFPMKHPGQVKSVTLFDRMDT
jgi:hypothetical protein